MQLKGDDATLITHLLNSEVNVLAAEYGWSSSQARAIQHYVMLVVVIAFRKRKRIPCDKELRRARLIQRCLPGTVKGTLCENIRFAV